MSEKLVTLSQAESVRQMANAKGISRQLFQGGLDSGAFGAFLDSLKNPYLSLLYSDIEVGETTGKEELVEDKDPFFSVDSDFENWNLIGDSKPTKKCKAKAFELVRDGKFAEIYGVPDSKLAWTRPQVKRFVKENTDKLHQEWGNFFLLYKNGEFFVADAYRHSDSWYLRVRRFSDGLVCHAEHRHRFFFPQLKP